VSGPRVGIPLVAIVGRPNVGKSTLFNRIVGGRTAIVEDRARTTRDRLYGDAEWNGRRFVVVDTGGLEIDPDDAIEARVQDQARLAIREADVIVFVVDAAVGLTAADAEAAEILRRAKAPIVIAVNKADNERRELEGAEFYSMGWDELYAISAAHGRGTGDLMDALVWALPPETDEEIARKTREAEAEEWAEEVAAGHLEPYVVGDPEAEDADADDAGEPGSPEDTEAARWDAAMAAEKGGEPAAIAFVGRPNVGKSSLVNALLGEDRAIVSDVPGTTRDAIDTRLAWGRSEVVLIDTAGIRRRGKVASGPAAEKYSTLRALKALGRADVAVLVIDAVEGLTAQDAHVAGYVVEEGKGLVIAVNKWDLLEEKTDRTFDQYTTWIRNEVPFLDFAPIISISAKTGQRVGRVLEAAVDIWGERRRRIGTGELNRLLSDSTERFPPPIVRGRRPKLFYATQAAVAPPTFVFFASDASSVHFSYRRYLENRLRETFGFDGTPIRLVFRDRTSVKLPRHKRNPGRAGGPKASMSKGSKPKASASKSSPSKPSATKSKPTTPSAANPGGSGARATSPDRPGSSH
jgi:GTP-binding protein